MKFYNNIENCIEFLNGQSEISVSFCSQKWINKIKKLQDKRPEDVKILAENNDGSIYAKIPVKYLKISAPKMVSDEQRQAASKRLKDAKNKNK